MYQHTLHHRIAIAIKSIILVNFITTITTIILFIIAIAIKSIIRVNFIVIITIIIRFIITTAINIIAIISISQISCQVVLANFMYPHNATSL